VRNVEPLGNIQVLFNAKFSFLSSPDFISGRRPAKKRSLSRVRIELKRRKVSVAGQGAVFKA